MTRLTESLPEYVRPPPSAPPPATRWRPPTHLRRLELRLANDLWQLHPRGPGDAGPYLQTILNALQRTRLLHNRILLLELAVETPIEATSLAVLITSAAQGITDLDIGVEHAADHLRAHDAKRQRRDSKRRRDYNGLRVGDRAARPSEKPGGRSTIRRVLAARRRLLQAAQRRGHAATVRVEVPSQYDRTPTNDPSWYDLDYLAAGVRSHFPGDRGFEHAHYIGLDQATIREVRCSWVQRLDGRPVIVSPDGRKALLGPHARFIEGDRDRRLLKATAANPDPLLWPADAPRAGDIESVLSPLGHLRRLRRSTGLDDVATNTLIETGLASLSLRGAPPEYLAMLQDLTDQRSILRLEDLGERVQNAVEERIDLGLTNARYGAVLGCRLCDVCLQPTDLASLACENRDCMTPAPPEPESTDPMTQLKATVLHVLDVLDDLRLAAEAPK